MSVVRVWMLSIWNCTCAFAYFKSVRRWNKKSLMPAFVTAAALKSDKIQVYHVQKSYITLTEIDQESYNAHTYTLTKNFHDQAQTSYKIHLPPISFTHFLYLSHAHTVIQSNYYRANRMFVSVLQAQNRNELKMKEKKQQRVECMALVMNT